MPSFSKPTDPPEFTHEIENFAASPFVAELFCRLEDQFVEDWRVAKSTEQREAAWHGRRAIDELRTKMNSIAHGKSVFEAHGKSRQRLSPNPSPAPPFEN